MGRVVNPAGLSAYRSCEVSLVAERPCSLGLGTDAKEEISGGVKRGRLISLEEVVRSSFDLFDDCWKDVGRRTISGGSIRLEIDGERVASSAAVGFGGVDMMCAGGER